MPDTRGSGHHPLGTSPSLWGRPTSLWGTSQSLGDVPQSLGTSPSLWGRPPSLWGRPPSLWGRPPVSGGCPPVSGGRPPVSGGRSPVPRDVPQSQGTSPGLVLGWKSRIWVRASDSGPGPENDFFRKCPESLPLASGGPWGALGGPWGGPGGPWGPGPHGPRPVDARWSLGRTAHTSKAGQEPRRQSPSCHGIEVSVLIVQCEHGCRDHG